MTASALAAAMDTAAKLSGASDSQAAQLRAHLAHLLTEHVYLTGLAVATVYHAGPASAEFEAAAAVLDENSTDLAAVIAPLAPQEEAGPLDPLEGAQVREETFLSAWCNASELPCVKPPPVGLG